MGCKTWYRRARWCYHERCNHSNWVWQHNIWDVGYKETALLRQWEEHAQAAIHSQHRSTEDDRKILLRILSIKNFIISSLIHLRDYALFAWTQVDTISVCTTEASQTFQRTYCSSGRASFNPHILSGLAFHHLYWYQLPCTLILMYRVITHRRVSRGLVVSGGGLVYGFYVATGDWSQIDPRALG